MEMNQVRYAVALARTLNFTRAAEQCNVTQPSLTRAIQNLEHEFGGELFRRERNLTHLTELGRAMIPHLERTMNAADEAKALALEFRRQDRAQMNLGLARGLSLGPIAGAIGELRRQLRGFSLTVVDSEQQTLIGRLLHGELDVAVIERIADLPDRLDSWLLSREGFLALMPRSHHLANREHVTVEDLGRESLIIQRHGPSIQTTELAADQTSDLPLHHICADHAQAQELVRGGLGIAIVPHGVSSDPDLLMLPITNLETMREISLTTVCGRRHSVAVAGLIRLVRARGVVPVS